MYVAPGLFSWRMAAGLLAFSSRWFALTIDHEPSYAARGAKHLVCYILSLTTLGSEQPSGYHIVAFQQYVMKQTQIKQHKIDK